MRDRAHYHRTAQHKLEGQTTTTRRKKLLSVPNGHVSYLLIPANTMPVRYAFWLCGINLQK